MNTTPNGLRVEYLDGAVLGLATGRPRLSWQLPAGSARQVRYRVRVGAAVGEWFDSADCVLVPWPLDPVPSRTRVEWSVQVVTDLGESDWSDPAWFETGLLEATDWVAEWVEPHDPHASNTAGRPPHLLRTSFVVHELPSVARLYASAHGVYEVFLNGHRVGDEELTPGFTSYWHHLDAQTFDVGDLLLVGENDWTVLLSDGWYRGKVGNNKDLDTFGDTTAFIGQLHLDHTVCSTGSDWTSTTGPILAADMMDGQIEDRRVAPGPWRPATVVPFGHDRLTASPAPPSRRVQEIRPVSVRRLDDRRQIVDLGQNINGWIRLGDLGPVGTELALVHGEALDERGDVTLEHLCFGELRLVQTDRVVAAGVAGEVFEPRHTMHGFQYVRVEGHPRDLTSDDVTGIVVHTDMRRTGSFRCSDERINRLHEIVDWSFRDNACEIPTDCPQRERSGWTGDWQAFMPTAALMYDVAGFSRKWLRSLAADQLPSGCLANTAPEPRRARRDPDDLTWTGMLGSAGWGDAIVIVPWHTRTVFGDESVLRDMWPTMVRWLDYACGVARERRHPSRIAARPDAAPHEEFLWDAGWHWGEWCEPGTPAEPFWTADQGHVATAYLHLSSRRMASIAELLGDRVEAARCRRIAEGALHAWRTEYLADDGRITVDTQATHVRALAFELVPEDVRPQTVRRLEELVREADTHLSTGFLATPLLLPTIADNGAPELAYDLLFQDTEPSWLTMVDRGATTVWEDWDGIDEHGTAKASLNHYSKGAVVSFLYTHTAGIRALEEHPGYRRFVIEPLPDRRLTWVEATHDSPYGRIASAWRVDGDRFELSVTVPPGTTCEVRLPDGTRVERGPGSATYSCARS